MLENTVEIAPTQTQYCLCPQSAWTYEDWLNFPDDGWKYEIIEGSYTLFGKHDLGDTVTSKQLPGFNIAVETIFNF